MLGFEQAFPAAVLTFGKLFNTGDEALDGLLRLGVLGVAAMERVGHCLLRHARRGRA